MSHAAGVIELLLNAAGTTLSLVVALIALRSAQRANAAADAAKLSAPDVRALVAELDNALEKMAAAQARDRMRRLREGRREEETAKIGSVEQPGPEPVFNQHEPDPIQDRQNWKAAMYRRLGRRNNPPPVEREA